MRHAVLEFEAQGLQVIPAAIDQAEPVLWGSFEAWVPDAGALRGSALSLKEWAAHIALHPAAGWTQGITLR